MRQCVSPRATFFDHRLVRLAILLFGGYLAWQMSHNILNLWSAKLRVETAEQQVAGLKAKRKALLTQISQASSSGFIERQAREKLGYVGQGQVVLVLPEDEVKKLSQTLREAYLKPQTLPTELPNWQRWWNYFFL